MKIVADVTLGEKLQEENPVTHELADYFEVDLSNARVLFQDPKYLDDYKKGPGRLTIVVTQSGSLSLSFHSLVDENPDEAEQVFRDREDKEVQAKRDAREVERKRLAEADKPDKDGFITSTSPSGAEVKIKPGATVDLKDIPGHGVNMDSLRDASQPSVSDSNVDQKEANSPARDLATTEGAKERFDPNSGKSGVPSVNGEPVTEAKKEDDKDKSAGEKPAFDPLKEPKV